MKKEATRNDFRVLGEDDLAACNGGQALPPGAGPLNIADLTYLGFDGSQHGQE